MMMKSEERYYQIGEVTLKTGVALHLLRQWEAKFPQLRPKRSKSNRRYYRESDIDIVRRINYLLRFEKLTIKGARLRLAQEMHGEGRPKSNREAVALVDSMEKELRRLIGLLDGVGLES